MLRQLRIENYALIDRLEIDFCAGLNVLTGETGSGKSIVVEAVGLLLGDKGAAEMIRGGADRARLTGIFSPARSPGDALWHELLDRMASAGVDVAAGEEFIIQRELIASTIPGTANGAVGFRSRQFLNNQPVTVALLKQVAPLLAEIHGQNEQQELYSASAQLDLLDRFAGLTGTREEIGTNFAGWRRARSEWEKLREEQQEWLRQTDLWKFQRREIDAAELSREFDHELDRKIEEEKRVLAHGERIRARLASAYDLLYDAAHSSSATIASAGKHLSEAAAYDTSLSNVSELLISAKALVEDAALAVRDRFQHLDSNPGRLEEIENRLAILDRLKRKYGPTLSDVMTYGDELARKIEQAESGEGRMEELEQRTRRAAAEYQTMASELSVLRRNAAKHLRRAVERELGELAMGGTHFDVRLHTGAGEADWTALGIDKIEFLIAPNAGEALGPLDRIVSGGEASRVMLALETVIASKPLEGLLSEARGQKGKRGVAKERADLSNKPPSHALIFDEVDSGIGGRAAETVGRKLRALGEARQVLCVTHLPQIASFAHYQFRVEKMDLAGRTVTRVEALDAAGRREELARMMGGTQITPALRKHAEQLLKTNAG